MQHPRPSGTRGSMSHSKQNLQKYYSKKWSLRASVVDATEVVATMQAIQNTSPIATVAVGRAMVASVLMAANLKDGHEVSVYFKGDGPLRAVFAESNYEGRVRGFTPVPNLQMAYEGGDIPIGQAIGHGNLTVTRSNPLFDKNYQGTVKIQTGEIGDDVAYWLHQSFQIPSVVSIGVQVDSQSVVKGAGGIIIELLPGAGEETIKKLESLVQGVQSISKHFNNGNGILGVVDEYLKPFDVELLESDHHVHYGCRCTKERLINSLILFEEEELEEEEEQKSFDL